MLNKNVLFSWAPLKYKYIKQTPPFLFQKLAMPLLSPWFNHPVSCWQINHPNHSSFPSKLNPNASHPSTQDSPPQRSDLCSQPAASSTPPQHMLTLESHKVIYLSQSESSESLYCSIWNVHSLTSENRLLSPPGRQLSFTPHRSTHCSLNFQDGQYELNKWSYVHNTIRVSHLPHHL